MSTVPKGKGKGEAKAEEQPEVEQAERREKRASAGESKDTLAVLPRVGNEKHDYLKLMGIQVARSTTSTTSMPRTKKSATWSPDIAAKLDASKLFKKFTCEHANKKGDKVKPQNGTETNAKSAPNAISRWMIPNNNKQREANGELVYILDLTGKNIAHMLELIRNTLGEEVLAESVRGAELEYNRDAWNWLIGELRNGEYRFPVRICGQFNYKVSSILITNNITLNYLYAAAGAVKRAINDYIINEVSYHYGGDIQVPTAKEVEEWMKENNPAIFEKFKSDNVQRTQVSGLEPLRTDITLYDIHLLAKKLTRFDKDKNDTSVKIQRYQIVDADGKAFTGTLAAGMKALSGRDIIKKIEDILENLRTETDKRGNPTKETKIDITDLAKEGKITAKVMAVDNTQNLEEAETTSGKETKKSQLKVYFPEVELTADDYSITVPENTIFVRVVVTEKQKQQAGSGKRGQKIIGNKQNYERLLDLVSADKRKGLREKLDADWNKAVSEWNARTQKAAKTTQIIL